MALKYQLDDLIKLLEPEIKSKLTETELKSFTIKPFGADAIEVGMGGKVEIILDFRLNYTAHTGLWDILADGVLSKLRRPRGYFAPPPLFEYLSILDSVVQTLRSALKRSLPREAFLEIDTRVAAALKPLSVDSRPQAEINILLETVVQIIRDRAFIKELATHA